MEKPSLKAHYLYVFSDGTYFTVIYDETGCKMPILAVVGIDVEGKREVLAFTVGERENQKAWEDLRRTSRTVACKPSTCGSPMGTGRC